MWPMSVMVFAKRAARLAVQGAISYSYDFFTYIRNSASISPSANKNRLIGRIWVLAHALEKGLALPSPRAGFGRDKLRNLLTMIEEYKRSYGKDQAIADMERVAKDIEGQLANFWRFGVVEPLPHSIGGVKPARPVQLDYSEYAEWFRTRSSERVFAEEGVPLVVLQECVELAAHTPSVCNRQPWHVHIYNSEAQKALALSLQHGNAGFGERASAIVLVTGDLSYFIQAHERNQIWIDGGMFAMGLVMALHAKGLACCCLNLSLTAMAERRLKRALAISPAERPIMMIAVGKRISGALVAASFRNQRDVRAT